MLCRRDQDRRQGRGTIDAAQRLRLRQTDRALERRTGSTGTGSTTGSSATAPARPAQATNGEGATARLDGRGNKRCGLLDDASGSHRRAASTAPGLAIERRHGRLRRSLERRIDRLRGALHQARTSSCFALPLPSEISFFQIDVLSAFGSFGTFGSFDFLPNEISFFRKDALRRSAFAAFGAFGSFGLRENEISFFRNDCDSFGPRLVGGDGSSGAASFGLLRRRSPSSRSSRPSQLPAIRSDGTG